MAQNRINNGQSLRTVKVSKKELLTKLKENRATRKKEEVAATEEYQLLSRLEVKTKKDNLNNQLEELYIKLENGPVKLEIEETTYFDISPPESHLADFDEVISMFEMSVEDIIELDSVEFANFVLNKWDFNKKLQETRAFYASKSLSIGSAR